MRGKAQNKQKPPATIRITPAYAGKSIRIAPVFITHRDHPRTCGEKRVLSSSSFAKMGSPPHMRGKVLRTCGRCGCPRDHPRVCGEKLMAAEQLGRTAGSPPHVRGKVGQLENHKMVVGITPACAGKSLIESCGNAGKKGHPRACGEKYRENTEAMRVQGSPPHMRGKVYQGVMHNLTPRITPAYAGKSPCCKSGRRRMRDHPRVCGEKACGCCRETGGGGSPPRMRGKEHV